MPLKINETEFGHSLPPEGPHTVSVHLKGWHSLLGLRDGNPDVLSRLKAMYPRFEPFGLARELSVAIHRKLDLPATQACIVLTSPDAQEQVRAYACSPLRGEVQVQNEADLLLRVVEVGTGGTGGADTVRLYVVVGPASAAKAMKAAWQTAGFGVSTRLAEAVLPHVDSTLIEVPAAGCNAAAAGLSRSLGLPDIESHVALRHRIVDLLQRSPIDPGRAAQVKPTDVYLYPTGMAAIYRTFQAMVERRPGRVLALGSVFKNTWQMLEESAGGMKHFGRCDAGANLLAEVEAWLEAEAKDGRRVSYCILEFPSNPILVSADLIGLSKLADKYDFPLVVDDTVGSFANIDLLPVADVVVTSLTKSFSGYADVMGGSAVLNPSRQAAYAKLAPIFASRHVNELFWADAAQLLSNSADYLERTKVMNRNAAAMAAALVAAQNSAWTRGVIKQVNYPPYADTAANYAVLMRPATPEFAPGYGCLLSLDFATLDAAVAYYDSSQFFQGPHLGAHRSLAMAFSQLAWGKDATTAEYHASYGVKPAQVRLSAGLEDEADVVAMVEDPLAKAVETYAASTGDSPVVGCF